MNEGDTSTGGTQVNPSNTLSPVSTQSPSPNPSTDSDAEADSVLTISHDDRPSMPSMPESQHAPKSTMTKPIASNVSSTQSFLSPASTASAQPGLNTTSIPPTTSMPQPATSIISPNNQPVTSSIAPTTPFVGQATPTLLNQPSQLTQSPQPLTSSIVSPRQSEQPPIQQHITSSNGDVVLGASTPKRTKKSLIISLAIIIVIIGIALLATFLLNRSKDKVSTKASFRQFMGYLISGEINNENITTFDTDNYYAIDDYFYQKRNEETQKYFSQLFQYWKDFANNDKQQEDEKNLITEVDNWLSVVDLYEEKYLIPDNEVLKRYLEGGEDSVATYFTEYFDIKEDISDAKTQYLYYQDDFLNSLLDLINIYINNGCVSDDKVDEMCVEQKGLYNSKEYQKMAQSAQAVHEYALYSKDQTKKACKDLINMRLSENG